MNFCPCLHTVSQTPICMYHKVLVICEPCNTRAAAVAEFYQARSQATLHMQGCEFCATRAHMCSQDSHLSKSNMCCLQSCLASLNVLVFVYPAQLTTAEAEQERALLLLDEADHEAHMLYNCLVLAKHAVCMHRSHSLMRDSSLTSGLELGSPRG